jgi:hypothetical protein
MRMTGVKVLGLALALLTLGHLSGEVLNAHGDAAVEQVRRDDVRLLLAGVSSRREMQRTVDSPRS